MVEIIPAILATTQEQFQKDFIKLSASASLVEGWIHIDFADNEFVPNKTIGADVVEKLPSIFQKEAHLMVLKPKEWIDGLKRAGFERVILHIEAEEIEDCINYAKERGLEVGLAIKSETDLEKLEPYIEKINVVLIMSVVSGFQGQPFLPDTLKKVEAIKEKGWSVRVGVDGAVGQGNIKDIIESGVDFVIVGSYLLKGNVDENLENLWEVINE